MKKLLLLLAFRLLAQEEFAGPFPSWSTIHPTGSDDTAAIQSALTKLGVATNSPVLYLAPGTYSVSRTLVLTARKGVRILGEHPGAVRVKWTGPRGGALLTLNGVAYSEVSRITFDGAGTAAVLIDQAWDGHSGFFDSGNQFADDVFTAAGTGIRGGNLDFGFAETSVKRSVFVSLGTGIALKNFNALDLWVWDSLFDRCGFGITNNPGAGNWRVYNSKFLHSSLADNQLGNTGAFSFVGNYSAGSAPFLQALGSNNPAALFLQANTIRRDAGAAIPVSIGDQGPVVLLDNRIGTGQSSAPAISANRLGDTDVISIGNLFAAKPPLAVRGRVTSLDDQSGAMVNLDEPVLPGVPPSAGSKVYEVRAGADSAAIQAAIDEAVKHGGEAPIIHLPYGTYDSVFVTVPASNLQVVGDGMETTRIQGSIRLMGPASHVTLRDFSISGHENTGEGIVVSGTNQPGARVFVDQVHAGSSAVNLLHDGADDLTVEARDFDHKAALDTSIRIAGRGSVLIFDGASFGNGTSYEVSGGTLVVRDLWHDGGGSVFLKASGASVVSVSGSMINLPSKTGAPAIALSRLTGTVCLLGLEQRGRIGAGAGSTGTVVAAGIVNLVADFFSGPPALHAAVLNNRQTVPKPSPGPGSFVLPDRGRNAGPILRAGVAQLRKSLPRAILPLPRSVTDVQIYRVGVDSCAVGIHVQR